MEEDLSFKELKSEWFPWDSEKYCSGKREEFL
jgi:hypothetical protein